MVTEKDLSKLPDQPGVYLMHGKNDEKSETILSTKP